MGENNTFNIKQVFQKGLQYWYLFLIITPLMLGAAYFYLKYAKPVYFAEAMLLIKDDENSGAPTEEIIFTELGLGKKNKTLENETLILKSTPLMSEVVKRLNLNYLYTALDGWKEITLYKNSPVEVVDWRPNQEGLGFDAVMYDNGRGGYKLKIEKQEFSGEFGKELQLPTGKVTLAHKPGQFAYLPIAVTVAPVIDIARQFAGDLKVEIMGDLSSTMHLSLKDHSPDRASDILTKLIEVYNEKSIEVKNRAYENTINMVNERIDMMANNLNQTEQAYEAYKRSNNMVELSAEGTMLMTELASSKKEVTDKLVQLEILSGIEDFLIKNHDNFEFVPTNLNLTNQTLTNQLTSFNELLNKRESLRANMGPENPELILAERQLRNLRQTIIDNIHSIKRDVEISSNASQGLKSNIESRLSSLPRRERELLEIERQKNLKENLYLFLLQKREEAAVSMAVTAARGRVVEPALPDYAPLSPKKSQIWLIALFLGLVIPTGIIFFLEAMNDKVMTEEDIAAATSVPLAGTLALSKGKSRVVVTENSRSALAEMFRLLRANLAYIIPGKELQTVLVTSSSSGEGKSFIAINLGMTLALAGKRVLILELDLRKPKQELYLNIEGASEGVVNYLATPSMTPRQIIRNTGLHPNLDFISSGPTPPNPGELIMSARLRELMEILKERYDFILLDAPPVGRVADALQMKDLAEATMFVVRTGYTHKGQLEIVNDIAMKGKLPKPFVVLNGVPVNKPGYVGKYGYGYGYGYGSSNGYYQEEKKAVKKQHQKHKQA